MVGVKANTKCSRREKRFAAGGTSGENNHLELLYDGVAMSIQQGYSTLLSPNTDCTLDEYRVYSQLVRQGYRLLRHSSQRKITRYERMIGLHQYIQPAKEKRTKKEDTQKEVNNKCGEETDSDMGSIDVSVKSEVKMETECILVVESEDRKNDQTGEDKSDDCHISPVKSEHMDSCHIPVVKSEPSEDIHISMVKTEEREGVCGPALKDESSERINVDIKSGVEMTDVPNDSCNPTLSRRVVHSRKHSRHLQLDIEEINLSDSEEMSSHNHWQLRSSTVECIKIMDCKTESEVEIIDKDKDGDNNIISSSIQSLESKITNSGTGIYNRDKNDLSVTSTNNESISPAEDDNVKANLGQQICDSSVIDVSFESNKTMSADNMPPTNSENFPVQKESRNIQEITIDSTSPEIMRDNTGVKHSTMFSNSNKSNSSPFEENPSSASVCRIRWYVKREPKFSRVSNTSTELNEGKKFGNPVVETPVSCDQQSGSHNLKSNIDCSENPAIKKEDDANIVNNEISSKQTNMKRDQSSEACDENTRKVLIEVLDITGDNSGGEVKITHDQRTTKDSGDNDDQNCSKIANLKQEDRLTEVLDATSGERCLLKADMNESTKVIEVFNIGSDEKLVQSNLKSSQPVRIFAVADKENSVRKTHGKQSCSVEIVNINDESSLVKEIVNQDQCPNVFDISDDDFCVKEEDEVSEIYDVTDDEDDVNNIGKVDTPEIIDLSDDEDSCRKRKIKGEDETPEVLDISDDSVKSDIEDGSQISEVMDVTDDEDIKPVVDLENDCDAVNDPDHCDERDHVNDDRYSPAPLNIGKEYYPSTLVYIPSRNTDLQAESKDKEDFISLKTENTHLESPLPISNLKRKYQADDECRDLDERLHTSNSHWVSPNHTVVDLSDDENRENVDRNNIKTEDMEERIPPSGNNVIKQEAASNIEKIEEELSKFYAEVEEIDLEEEKKEVNEDRWTILDSFPNAYGELVLNVAVPPARLLPPNVCPSKSHYLIPVTRRISPPIQNYRNRNSPNYRNNWRGRHRNHSRDRSRNHQRNSMRRNFEYRGMTRSDSEHHSRFGHQNVNEANLDNHRQFQYSGINGSNPDRQHFENHDMTNIFSDHRTFEYQENKASSEVQGPFDPQRINEANIDHRRHLEHRGFSLTDTDYRRCPGQQRLNQANPELRRYLEHQGMNDTNPEHGRHSEHKGMIQRNSEQRMHLEREGINPANPEHRRHIDLQGGKTTSSEHRRHLGLQEMNQLTPDRRKSREHQGVYQTTPKSGSTLEHQRMIQTTSGHRRQLERRKHFEPRGINQATPELRKPPDFQGMDQANPDHRRLTGHRGINQTNLELRRNQGHEEMNVINPGQWGRNLTPSWSNTEVSFDYHHQTPALHAAQVAYNLITQQFSPQVLFPTMLSSSQSMWLGPQLPQTWLQGQRVLDRQPQELRPQARFPLNDTWSEGNCERNIDSFMDTDERQLPQQRFARTYGYGRGYSNLLGNRPQCPERSQNSFMKMKFKLPRYFAPPRKLQRLMDNITYDDDALSSEDRNDRNATVSSSVVDDIPHSSPESSDDEEIESLVKPEDCTTVGNILSRLQIIKSTNFGNINSLSEASDVLVKYDLYLPDTVFRKSNPSLPDFRLIILGFRQTFPSPGKMAALQQEYHDDVPFLLAIVLPDAVTFFQYSVITLPVLDASSLNG
ncbi:uncharacterized protein [Anabrus simplex]|uniref:uncharacterized protein isoform X2 n=1 Tax=Anabrus simplex TaxID=316456 RepID=UPI0035A3AD8D